MKATDPSGQVWRVSRRWLPWRRRAWSREDIGIPDPTPDSFDVDDLVMGLVVVVVFVVIAIFAPWLILGVFIGVEFLLLLLLLPAAVIARVVFGKAWHVEVRHGWTAWHEEQAGDWQASGLRIHDLSAAVRRGEIPERTLTPTRERRETKPGR